MELNLAHVFGAAATSMRAVNVKGPASILIMVMRRPVNRPAVRYRAGAPAASHAAITARSEPVISVILPGGIALDHAALRPIRRALRRMWSASSKRIAFGAIANVGHTGSAAWHMLHRVPMIRWTSAKLAPDTSPVTSRLLASRGPAADKNAIASIPTAATPHTHQGDPRPECREL